MHRVVMLLGSLALLVAQLVQPSAVRAAPPEKLVAPGDRAVHKRPL